MKDTLILQDKNYISAKRVCELFGYTTDYVGQLCRAGKLDCKMIGRTWFVTERSVIDYKSNKNYIPTKKVNELFGYTADYVGQLCRAGKLDCKMIGRSWFVTETSVLEHMSIVEEIAKNKSKEKKKKNVPIISPISPEKSSSPSPSLSSSLKSQFENKPLENKPFISRFASELKQKAVFIPSLGTSKASLLNSKYILFITTLLIIVSTFAFSISINLKNTISNSSQSNASLSSLPSEIIRSINRGFVGISNFIVRLINGESSNSPKVAVSVPYEKFNGLAVVPSTDSKAQDEVMKQKIRDSFSDEITIKPDKSGTAGVITPMFKKAKGNDFVYVLVPVKN